MSRLEKAGGTFHLLFSFRALDTTALRFEYKVFFSLCCGIIALFSIHILIYVIILDFLGQRAVFALYCLDFHVFRSYNVKAFYVCEKLRTIF